MDSFDNNLDQLLDAWRTPALQRDLTEAIVARAQAEDRSLDELLTRMAPAATLDRDLAPAILARARAEEDAFDRLLDAAAPTPRLTVDLAQPVLRAAHRGKLRRRILVLAASLSAAAAVLIVALVHPQPIRTGGDPHQAVMSLFTADQQQTLGKVDVGQIIEDMPVLVHWETIREMEQLEQQAPGDSGLPLGPTDGSRS
ncbi:MAG: hypothetical protein PHU85_06130 [Phycisphaerae bacterium]|nr:hypothetical protein [Phycisphaerae bacterium]